RKRLGYMMGLLMLSLGGLTLVLPARTDEPAAGEGPPPKTVASRITQGTVYPNSALGTREVEVPAGTGLVELVVKPVPPHTVNSPPHPEGRDGIRGLTTRSRPRPVKEDTREEVRKLEDEAKKLQQLAQRLQAELGVVQQNMQMYTKLENFTTANTQH